ncbi:hypothetical protein BH11ACT8_BH11ACT8_03670 [soil metagenome]
MTTRTAGRIVGALILGAFFLYGGGSFLVVSSSSSVVPLPQSAESPGRLVAGSALLLLNSLAVAVVGVLAFRVLRDRHPRTANAYLATRTVEAVLLALAPLGMITLALLMTDGGVSATTDSGPAGLARTAVENSESAYWVAMTALGAGSIFFCRALLRTGLLPRPLARWGMVGYAVFALGGILEMAGYGVGLALSVPGGLFEVAAGVFLLTRGFRSTTPTRAEDERPDHDPGPHSATLHVSRACPTT